METAFDEAIPAAHRIVIDALSERAGRDSRIKDREGRTSLNKNSALRQVAKNAFSGAEAVWYHSLMRMYGTKEGVRPADEELLFDDIASENDLLQLDLSRIAAIAARLRLDELQRDLEGYIRIGRNGLPAIARADIPTHPGPVRPRVVNKEIETHHEARLGCPALHVTGGIRLVTWLMPRIIIEAQRRVQSGSRAI